MEAEYKSIWRSSTEAPRAWIPDRSSHRRAEPEDIRRAARTFPSTTSAGLDGLHPRRLLHLSDDALRVLAV
eukprot:1964455-Pyramimonas_sp.AAC.1